MRCAHALDVRHEHHCVMHESSWRKNLVPEIPRITWRTSDHHYARFIPLACTTPRAMPRLPDNCPLLPSIRLPHELGCNTRLLPALGHAARAHSAASRYYTSPTAMRQTPPDGFWRERRRASRWRGRWGRLPWTAACTTGNTAARASSLVLVAGLICS
jgi:hypothetical protein